MVHSTHKHVLFVLYVLLVSYINHLSYCLYINSVNVDLLVQCADAESLLLYFVSLVFVDVFLGTRHACTKTWIQPL